MLTVAATDSFTTTLHQGFFRVVLIYAIAMSLWGLFLWVRGSNPTGSYLGALVIAEVVAVVQGLIGLVLLVQGHRPHDNLHFLYGIVAVVALPAAYSFSDRGTTRRDSLVFALGTLFLVGIALRAATTAAGS